MAQKTVAGPMAVVYVKNNIVGIFESVNYQKSYGTEAIHLLGRFSADEIAITSAEAVTVSCSGFRIVDQGVHVLPAVPKVQDLLNFEPFTINIVERKTGKTILTVLNCVPTSDNGNHNAKATSRVQVSYIGTIGYDESGEQGEGSGATSLP